MFGFRIVSRSLIRVGQPFAQTCATLLILVAIFASRWIDPNYIRYTVPDVLSCVAVACTVQNYDRGK